jgi:hypothetical protein
MDRRFTPNRSKAGTDPRRASRRQLATFTAAVAVGVALLVTSQMSQPLPAGSIVTVPASHDARAGSAPYEAPGTAAAFTRANVTPGDGIDPADCTAVADTQESCARARDLITILQAAGEPLRQDQINPLIAALSGVQIKLPARMGNDRNTPSGAAEQIRRLKRDVAEVQLQAAAFASAITPMVSHSQAEHFVRYLDEEREARQVELDVARENAGALQP